MNKRKKRLASASTTSNADHHTAAPQSDSVKVLTGTATDGSWMKDFVEHLRFVHLLIVTASATLLAAIWTFDSKGTRRELDTIHNLVRSLDPQSENNRAFAPGAIESLLRAQLTNKTLSRPNLEGKARFDTPSLAAYIAFGAPSAFVFHSDRSSSETGKSSVAYSDIPANTNLRPTHKTLVSDLPDDMLYGQSPQFIPAEFWEALGRLPRGTASVNLLWDACDRMRHAYALAAWETQPRAFVVRSSGSEAGAQPIRGLGMPLRNASGLTPMCKFLVPVAFSWAPTALDHNASNADRVVFASLATLTVDDTWADVGYPELSRMCIAIMRQVDGEVESVTKFPDVRPGDIVMTAYAEYRHVPIDIQEVLLNGIHENDHRKGPFDRAFPAMSRLIQSLEYDGDIPLPMMQALVRREEARGGSPVEIAGLKIEHETLRLGGVAVLLTIQIYFLIHLREFRRRARSCIVPPAGQSWMGLYPGAMPLFVNLASIGVLPFTVAVGVLTSIAHWTQWASILLCVAVLVLAVLSSVTAVRLRRLAAMA